MLPLSGDNVESVDSKNDKIICRRFFLHLTQIKESLGVGCSGHSDEMAVSIKVGKMPASVPGRHVLAKQLQLVN